VAHYRFDTHVNAPPDLVFDLWTDPERWREWIGGVTKVTDISGPLDRPGTRYTVWFGRMRSPTEVLDVERPRLFRTRFGSALLRGENSARFDPEGDGTRLTQEYHTIGRVSAVAARIFAAGSYKGSFRGELNEFVRLAEREGYHSGALKVGGKVWYADPKGNVMRWRVEWIKHVKKAYFQSTFGEWAANDSATPIMTLQTCDGKNDEFRIIVRLVPDK
jgi:uncharacterized protein YndB with AHSA1/START domain